MYDALGRIKESRLFDLLLSNTTPRTEDELSARRAGSGSAAASEDFFWRLGSINIALLTERRAHLLLIRFVN